MSRLEHFGAGLGRMETSLLRQRSVYQNANEHHVERIVQQHAQPAPGPLYRGIAVHPGRSYLDPEKVKVGDRLHLPVSSFTADRDTAHDFAQGDQEEHGGQYQSVVLHAEGAHGIDMSPHSNMPWEKEWLTKPHHFEVTHKTSDPENDIDHVIHLRAVDQ